MNKYRISYTLEGGGQVEVKANNLEEAKEKYYKGEFDSEAIESCERTSIDEITEII